MSKRGRSWCFAGLPLGDLRRKADPGRLAAALLAAVQGGTLLAQLRRGPSHLETALDEVLDRIEDLRPRRAQLRQYRCPKLSSASWSTLGLMLALYGPTRPGGCCFTRMEGLIQFIVMQRANGSTNEERAVGDERRFAPVEGSLDGEEVR